MQVAVNSDGYLVAVEDDVMRVVNEIRDRWPDLRVMCLSERAVVEFDEAPYRILDSAGRVVLNVWKLDQSVINRLYMRDMDARYLQQRFEQEVEKAAEERRRQKEEVREERKDIMRHVFESPKTSYTFRNPDTDEIAKVVDG